MSVFLNLPMRFPLDVDLSQRPVTYHLQMDRSDAIGNMIVSIIFLILGSFGIYYLVTQSFMTDPQSRQLSLMVAGGLIALFLILVGWIHTLEEIDGDFSRVSITVTDDRVNVIKSGPFGTKKWSHGFDEFEGLVLQRHGNHTLDNEKIAISAVSLKHPIPARSVPLCMRLQDKIGEKTLNRIADETGIPIYKIEAITLKDEDEIPPGTVLINQGQGIKVYLLYLITLAGSGVAILWCLYEMFIAGTILGWAMATVAFAALLMAIIKIYASRYVATLRIDGDNLWLTTISLKMPEQKISRRLVGGIAFKKGRFSSGVANMNHRLRVNAPWFKVRIKGYTLPFIIDKQAEYLDEKLLMKLRLEPQED